MSSSPRLLDAALQACRAGISVLPAREDGSKAPIGESWTRFQRERASEQEITQWYRDGRTGIGYVCGPVSDDLELLDFDDRATFDEFRSRARAAGLGDLLLRVEQGYTEFTPRGAHLFYRSNGAKTEKLAQAEDGKALIETKGAGGYAVVAPSHGRVHPSGKPYRLTQGGPETVARITPEERAELHRIARTFDQREPRTPAERPAPSSRSNGELRPGDDFTARATWGETLKQHGWVPVFARNGATYWRRPGKDRGISATTNHEGSDLFYVFSTATPFEARRSYDRFGAYAVLNHGGDHRAAARELGSKGYGEQQSRSEMPNRGSQLAEPVSFPSLIPLDDITTPEFPVKALPHWTQDFVEAEAEATQTPADLAGMLVLAAVATAIQKRLRVHVREGYSEPTNIFTATALPPGNRKSQVFADVSAPILAHERRCTEIACPEVATAAARLDVLRARQQKLRTAAASGDSSRCTDRLAEIDDLAKEIVEAEMAAPQLPRFLTDDVTPETLAVLLNQHGGRMAIWSAEGGELFEMMRGRYSGNARPNLGVFLKAHAGDLLAVDRKRGSIYVEEPALTIGLAIQPSVIRSLRDEGTFRERGLLGRFLYALPRSSMGERDWRAGTMPPKVAAEYEKHLTTLLSLPPNENTLQLEAGALEGWLCFAEELEPQLAEEAAFGSMADWAGKLPGTVIRLAGVLHAVEWVDRSEMTALEIDTTTMERAIALGRYALVHAQAAFAEMVADPAVEGARKIWRSIAARGSAEITQREIQQGVKGGRFPRLADMEPSLAVLVERGYLALKLQPKQDGPKRGRPTVTYFVNPRALDLEGAGGNGGISGEGESESPETAGE